MLLRINIHHSQLFLLLFLVIILPCFHSRGGLTPLATNVPLKIIVTPAIATLYTEPHDWACFEQLVSVFGNGQFDGGLADLLQVSCSSTGALENIPIDPPAPINQEPAFISSFVLKSTFLNCSSVNISIGYEGTLRVPLHNLRIAISQQEMPVLEWEICREKKTVEFFMVPKYGDYSSVQFEDLVLQMDSVEGECGNFLVWEARSWSFSSVPAKRQRIAHWRVPETGEWTGTLDFMAVQKGTYQLRSQVHAYIEAGRSCCSSESHKNSECSGSESHKNSECSGSEGISIPEFVLPEFSLELQDDLVEGNPNSPYDSGIEYESDSSASLEKNKESDLTPFLEWNENTQNVKVEMQQRPKGNCPIETISSKDPKQMEQLAVQKLKSPKKHRKRAVERSQDSIPLGFFEGQSKSTEESFGIEEEPLGFTDPDWRHSILQENNYPNQDTLKKEQYFHDLGEESTSDLGVESSEESLESLDEFSRPRAKRKEYYEMSVRDSDYQQLTGKKGSYWDSSVGNNTKATNENLQKQKESAFCRTRAN